MICPDCGTNNSANEAVCTGCGEALVQPKANYSKDFAWASLVLGIVSMLIFPYLYGPLAVLSALKAKKQGYAGKKATVGLLLGVVAVLGWVITQIISGMIG